MKLHQIKRIYFIGIGGIGMSAVARYFLSRKVAVSGYDKTETPLTKKLVSEGIEIHFLDSIDLLDKAADIVVYTPAIPSNHNELNWYRNNNYLVWKRSDMLQLISEEMKAICVGGTHGKTTVSSMIAHAMRSCNRGCNAFLGGIAVNYNTNYWGSNNPVAVIEADEYDRSFLKLNPSITVITAMDPDHLDIYGTVEEMERCYLEFIAKTKDTLIYKHGLKRAEDFQVEKKFSYSIHDANADYTVSNVTMKNGAYSFGFHRKGKLRAFIDLQVGGIHNMENALAACAVADVLGMHMDELVIAMARYAGVKRRFEYIVRNNQTVYIDDYAHHPEELRVLLESARALFPERKLCVAFQPHLFTRTRDLADGFASSLDLADEVLLLDIYPARELPIEGVHSRMITERMKNTQTQILSKEELVQWVSQNKPSLFVTAGAGDIDTLIPDIQSILLGRK